MSNEELLEILSQTKDPLLINNSITKCFEEIGELEFNKDNIIIGMFSMDKEHVTNNDPIDPKGVALEFWMTDVENMMKDTIRK